MMQDHITMSQRHTGFVKKVGETSIVFALENADGYATSSSNSVEDEDGIPVALICFWSQRALADACRISDWADYRVVELPLSEFIENWCVGLYNDGLLVGTDFDRNMFGFEAEPLDLIIDLINDLKINGKKVTFKKYTNLQELELRVKSLLSP